MLRFLLASCVLLVLACEGHLVDNFPPGTNEPPTTNAALAFPLGGTGTDGVVDLAADPAGAFTVLGSFSGTIDFDPDVAITPLTPVGGTDAFLASYAADGALVWVTRIGGLAEELPAALARDAAGNLYVGGQFAGSTDFDPGSGTQVLTSAGDLDGFVAKYSPAGTLLWARRFGGTGQDAIVDLAVDPAGNVYAGGTFSGSANALPTAGFTILSDGAAGDGFLLSFDANGAFRWALPIGGSGDDAVRAVAVGAAGTPLVAGDFRGTADFARNGAAQRIAAQGGSDVFLASYTAAGILLTARAISGPSDESVTRGGLALDALGGAGLLGRFSGTVDFDPGAGAAQRASIGSSDLFLARYDATGVFVSVATFGGTGTLSGGQLRFHPDGGMLLTGGFSGSVDFDPGTGLAVLASLAQGGASDAFVARYAADGGLLWVTRFGEATAASDRQNSGTAVGLDPAGKVLVAGRFFGTPDFDPGSSALRFTSLGGADGFVLLLTAAGALATLP